MALAAWNRWRAVPALAAAQTPNAGNRLRRVIAVEYLLILVVLATTATLTTFYSP
jgi:putative copper export protein